MFQKRSFRVARQKYKNLKDKAGYKAWIDASIALTFCELGKCEMELDKIRGLQARLKKELKKFRKVHEIEFAC